VRIERRMLSSERGYGRPVAERPHGARSLLYSLVSISGQAKEGPIPIPVHFVSRSACHSYVGLEKQGLFPKRFHLDLPGADDYVMSSPQR
jgi:hypothetical protein